MNRGAYILYRLVSMIPTLLGALVLIFLLAHAIKGDPARMMAGDQATPEVVARIRQEFQLDKPLPWQFVVYTKNLLTGNFGISYQTKRPVLASMAERFPATMELTLASFVFAILGAVPLGVISAMKRNRPVDHLVRVISVAGVGMPAFWSGLMLIWLLYLKLGWLPGGSRLEVFTPPPRHITGMYTVDSLLTGNWAVFREAVRHLILPSFILGYSYMAVLARTIRSSMLEVLAQDYIRTARAKGLPERAVVMRHALRNALMPVTTLAGLAFAILLGGAVLTETIFSWPGMGKYVVDAGLSLDYPVITGFTLCIAVIYMFVNLGVDLMYSWLNPQIK